MNLPLLRARSLYSVMFVSACTASPADEGGSSGDATDPGSSDATSVDSSGSDDASSSIGPGESSGSDSTGALDPCTTALGTGPDPIFERPAGRFVLFAFPTYLSVRGSISDGPPLEFHHETERSGMCRLLRFGATTCTPACEAPAVCVDDACVSAPASVPAGELTLDGVGLGPIAVLEDPFHAYYWDAEVETELDMPRLVASGDEVPAFELSACPVDAPTATGDWSALLDARADGESVTLTWADPLDTARIYLRMTTGIGTHGGISPVEIECEGPDVGELVLPGSYLDALYAEGWSCGECGGNDLIRYHADRTDGPEPTVELRVAAATNFWHIP
jgi:hypothetical protein